MRNEGLWSQEDLLELFVPSFIFLTFSQRIISATRLSLPRWCVCWGSVLQKPDLKSCSVTHAELPHSYQKTLKYPASRSVPGVGNSTRQAEKMLNEGALLCFLLQSVTFRSYLLSPNPFHFYGSLFLIIRKQRINFPYISFLKLYVT